MIATESIIIGVCFVILLLILFAKVIVPLTPKKQPYIILIITLIIIPAMIINLYTVNCTVYGNCNVLAKVFATVTVIGTLIYLAVFIKNFVTYKKSLES